MSATQDEKRGEVPTTEQELSRGERELESQRNISSPLSSVRHLRETVPCAQPQVSLAQQHPSQTSLVNAEPPPRGYHVDLWTKILTTIGGFFFGVFSILSWQSSQAANAVTSQAVDAQTQANQLALYSYCALSIVSFFGPILSMMLKCVQRRLIEPRTKQERHVLFIYCMGPWRVFWSNLYHYRHQT